MGQETSQTRLATTNGAGPPDFFSAKAPTAQRRQRIMSIATDGWRAATSRPLSWLLVLFRQRTDRGLCFLHVVQRQFPGLDKMCHHGLGPTAKQVQQVVDQSALRGITGDRGLENIGVADPLYATESLLAFQAVDRGLNRREGGSAALGERLMDLANGAGTLRPQRLHDPKFELR